LTIKIIWGRSRNLERGRANPKCDPEILKMGGEGGYK